MATYATYFHAPTTTVVHNSPSTYSTFGNSHLTLQLHGSAQSIPCSAPHIEKSSALPHAKCESVSTGLNDSMTNTNEQEESIFFRLPAELRNQIYTELLCPDGAKLKDLAKEDKDLSTRHFNQTSTSTSLYPAILSTCRKAHDEASALLYDPHIFHAHSSLLTSLPHLTSPSRPVLYPSVTSLISRWQISLRLDTDPRFTFSQATAAFSGAEYLEIRVWQAQFEACDYSVLKLFTGVRGVQVAKVGGSVDPELARWLEQTMMLPQEEKKEEGVICRCDEGCPGWEGRRELLCGRCYRKVGVEWVEKEWDLWRFGEVNVLG